MQMSHRRHYWPKAPIGRVKTSLQSPAPTTSADYAALGALSSDGRPEFGFEPERMAALPDGIEKWSLTSLREKLVKIGAKLVAHGRYMTFQMAEVAVPRDLFRRILQMIDGLRPERPARC